MPSKTKTKVYHTREAQGTAVSGFIEDLYNPREAIKEAVSNGFNWIHKAIQAGYLTGPKPVVIRLHDGISRNDIQIEDPGLGFESFTKVQKSGALATTQEEADELARRRDDPDYSGRFGVGLNGMLALSEKGEIEIRTVHVDELDRTSGFICTLNFVKDELGNKIPQYSDPEVLDSKYIMNHTGCIITVFNAKKGLSAKTLDAYLSKVFYRKLSEGYRIIIRDLRGDNISHPVFIPEGVCCDHSHEIEIGPLSNGYPVYAHLHTIENGDANAKSTNIDILIKKIGGFGLLPIDRKATGYVWTSGILPQMGRGTVRDDPESPFAELCELVDKYCELMGIPRASEDHTNDTTKNTKQLKDTVSQIFTKFFAKNPHLLPPEMKAKIAMDPLDAQKTKPEKGWDKNKEKEKEEEENQKPDKVKKRGRPKKKYIKHKKHKRQLILSDGEDSKVSLGVDKRSVRGAEVCWIDPVASELIINSAYPNSAIYRMCFGKGIMNMEHYTTYALMAVIKLGYRDQVLTAGQLLTEIGSFWES